MNTVIALSSNQTAWSITLVIGLVVAIIVWTLLEALRRSVREVEQTVRGVWEAGKGVEHNTVMIHSLKSTRERGAELVEELGHHG